MHFFTDYIQPLTLWLYSHPHLALLITFLISFSESLAIVGSIIPGSVTMTAIGILAGSGIMRIDLTFIAATLGAIAGDTSSYTIGYTFSDRLANLWPFNRYPSWLAYGKAYFERYGSTSVLIGRFVGPMRSIIPVIAGMMHMNRWHFLLANVISGIAWAILYVLPGVLIGAAGSELSTESATRLFALILILLVTVWLVGLGVNWLFVRANQFLHTLLHRVWIYLKSHKRLTKYANRVTPHHETNHYRTAALMFLLMLCFMMSILMITLIFEGSLTNFINKPAYLFLQSLQTPSFNAFFIILGLIISPIPLLTLLLSFAFYTLYYRDWRTLGYWLSLCITNSLIIFFFISTMGHEEIDADSTLQLFSTIDLTMATGLFGFFILYVSTYFHTITLLMLRVVLLTILCLAGIGFVYLGDNWLINVMAFYFIGLTICLLHWVFYRRHKQLHQRSQQLICLSLLLLTLASCFSCLLYFNQLVRAHSPQLPQYVMTDSIWWKQQQPLLPIYSTNRIGKRTGLLNIQYAGSITLLEQALEEKGWKSQSTSFFHSLLLRAGGNNAAEELPLMAQLYLNRKPVLLMTYNPGNQQDLLVLRLWRSNYHLRQYHEPIWLGNLAPRIQYKPGKLPSYQAIAIHNYMILSLPGFMFNQVWFPKPYLKPLPYPTSRVLLLIKPPIKKSMPDFSE